MLHYMLVGVATVAGIVGFGWLLWHFRRQRDFEGTGHMPPEDYD
jgi:hypothetical protein